MFRGGWCIPFLDFICDPRFGLLLHCVTGGMHRVNVRSKEVDVNAVQQAFATQSICQAFDFQSELNVELDVMDTCLLARV